MLYKQAVVFDDILKALLFEQANVPQESSSIAVLSKHIMKKIDQLAVCC